ncbi:MAG: GGDEF domain-containing protein [Candidatus Shapirobacteria bacterium]|jgi:diguanylate cyclase (GGDEF)-like protein
MVEKNGLGFIGKQVFENLSALSSKDPQNPIMETAEKMHQKINMDLVTGCYNRNFWEEFTTIKKKENTSIIMCDVDGLKKINDEKGHLVGDNLIKSVASYLKKEFNQENNIVIRYGGDEFIIICTNIKDKDSFLTETIEKFNSEKLKGFNVSFGIAHFDSSETSLKDTFNRADDLMYRNKKEGYIQSVADAYLPVSV